MSKLAYVALGTLAGCVCTLIVLAINVAMFFTTKPDLSPETFGMIGLVLCTFANIIAFFLWSSWGTFRRNRSWLEARDRRRRILLDWRDGTSLTEIAHKEGIGRHRALALLSRAKKEKRDF